MKKTTFNVDPLKPGAMLTLQKHRDTYPNGMPTYGTRSNRCTYVSLGYVVYETNSSVVISELG